MEHAGTLAGQGSFRCEGCGYLIGFAAGEELPECPGCGARAFVPAPLGGDATFVAEPAAAEDAQAFVGYVRALLSEEPPGEYLAYADGTRTLTIPLSREWTRIGRSLAANIRFDDPTVSRRHALVVRTAEGVRVLDDRSLNGVFVNSARVEWSRLADGDEILVGRHRLHFVVVPATLERESSVIPVAGAVS